jgi:hypothetical protein
MRDRECQPRRNSPNWTRETRKPKLPFGSHDMQEFFYCELTWARAARVAAGTRDAARSARFRTGQSPSAAGAAGGTEGLGVTLSLQTLSYAPASDGASRFNETDDTESETTRGRDGKACARNTVAQTRRVHAISTLLLSAGSTGSSPHPAPCGVSVGYPRVRSTSSTPDWVLFSAFDFSARVRLFESTSRTRVCTRAIAAQPRPRLAQHSALAVFSSLC